MFIIQILEITQKKRQPNRKKKKKKVKLQLTRRREIVKKKKGGGQESKLTGMLRVETIKEKRIMLLKMMLIKH